MSNSLQQNQTSKSTLLGQYQNIEQNKRQALLSNQIIQCYFEIESQLAHLIKKT